MSESAAFFRFEGTLTGRPTFAAAAWLAAAAMGTRERLLRLGNMAIAAPFVFASPLKDPKRSQQLTWMGLRGMSEDRLAVLGEEYARDILLPSLQEKPLALLKKAQATGTPVVLISDNLDSVMTPIAEALGVTHCLSNRMELVKQEATGRLVEPIVTGHLACDFVKRYAAKHGFDLARSTGYGAGVEDGLLLSSLGNPCAVQPDRGLRHMARDLSWPVVEW